MSSAKKKINSDQIPKPISIKKEKTEEDRTLQPISHYIDDRLELVKQIFGTLKPKTIVNLAPEFLKKKNLDEIEELCLNELLCISTKRLKSIIEDTRCPTDTESSEDSDVEHKEEHISLEEISSDSDIGGSENRRSKCHIYIQDHTRGSSRQTDGQISVLELLELQARARAIRSQLAMEPITKIEVKSDDEEQKEETVKGKASREKRSSKTSSGSSKRKSSEKATGKETSREAAQALTNGATAREAAAAAPVKRIKLKRNYRHATKSPEKQPESQTAVVEQPEVTEQSAKSRSASPDVIPIPAEPETLLISDSTDDEEKQEKPQKPEETKQTEQPPAVEPEPVVESEPEEGEVRDESDAETESPTAEKGSEAQQPQPQEQSAADSPQATGEPETSDATEKTALTEDVSEQPEASKESSQTEATTQQPPSIPIVDDEDQNDDVISIGGDLEMIEELAKVEDEPEVKVKSEASENLRVPDEEDNDVISLNTSEDEHEKLEEPNSESWRTRYLKSTKVSQVLAASRLGKRVRDKIKKSKRAQKHSESKEAGDEKAQQQQQQFTSKHEDGSMEQYQELLQHRQRKGDK
ncbi:hypothetical protein KR222_003128 [Zaprionus bogoriensis]|nr:hypothetical protein KR222_003128 [Zaprionus bogoriensis]